MFYLYRHERFEGRERIRLTLNLPVLSKNLCRQWSNGIDLRSPYRVLQLMEVITL
jgi:hypothetical protein